jgi:CO/xanthine dehydrogenase FAD-binding subunit
MQPFVYAKPATVSEALALLGEYGSDACLLAGGTDVVVSLRNRTLRPSVVIDLKAVAEMRPAIDEAGGRLTIGANTVLTDLGDDARIRRRFPALVEAMATVGSNQIRNRATLTGNICHASPAADTAPALLVYGAAVNVADVHGSRRVNLADFFVGPGQTVLQPGELVTSIELPLTGERRGAAFVRITRRHGVDLATISLCCLVQADGRTRFAFGAVGPRPLLVDDDSGLLADAAAGEAAKDEVLRRLVAQTSPISDVRGSREYRAAMLLLMSRRALRSSIERLRVA